MAQAWDQAELSPWNQVQNMIKNGDGTDSKFLDASNRFFTLIPHDFGMNTPPILNEPDYIKSKIEMLDNLLEIEVAYKLIKVRSMLLLKYNVLSSEFD